MQPLRRACAAALVLLLAFAPAAALRRPERKVRVYDPEIALLVLNIQKQSIPLLARELLRQSEWMGLSGAKVLLDHNLGEAVAEVQRSLDPDSDVLEGFQAVLVRFHPAASQEIDRLITEVRHYHDLRPGSPLTRLPLPKAGRSPRILAEQGVGADVENELFGTQTIKEPVAFAERRFGSTGPFLSRRQWDIDFFLGDFRDLLPYYRRLGYQVFYRLRAPYVSYGKEAYVLAPEGELRPRLVYCGFHGLDFFRHVRAQYAILARNAGKGPMVRTLHAPDIPWALPSVQALRGLIATIPYSARNAVMGYSYLFEQSIADRHLGTYENDSWRLRYYDLPSGVTALLENRHTGFGEISAAALEVMAAKGAQRLFYAGPAAAAGAMVTANRLCVPQEFLDAEGQLVGLRNSLPMRRERSGRHQSLASPLFATTEWLAGAADRGVETVDCEAAAVAQRIAAFNAGREKPVELGLALITSELSDLHPDEDRAVYTVEYETQAGREGAKRAYRDTVLRLLRTPPPESEED